MPERRNNMAKKTVKTSFKRIIAVLCGVFGAGWLFSSVWRGVFDYVESYDIKSNFFSYFFGTGLFSVSTLLISVLFFIVSLRDLEPLKNAFAVVTAAVSAVAFVAYIVYISNNLTTFGDFVKPAGIIDVSCVVLLAAYVMFALYCRNGGTVKNSAWTVAVIAIVMLFGGVIYGYIVKDFGAKYTISEILTGFAHLALFYCGLRQY